MKHLLLTKKTVVLAMLSLALSTEMKAADTFVVFEPAAGAWQLSNPTIGFAEGEHSCVKIAAANLAADFEKVTGTAPSLNSQQNSPSLLIGTVGVNKQIDQWVKQGVLSNLKGKKLMFCWIEKKMKMKKEKKKCTL